MYSGVGLCIQWMVEAVKSGGVVMCTVDGGGCKE